MAVSADLSTLLDKAYEDKTLSEILAASPAALAIAAALNRLVVPRPDRSGWAPGLLPTGRQTR